MTNSRRTSSIGAREIFDLKFLRSAALAPDGARLAYSVSRVKEGEEIYEIWVRDVADDSSPSLIARENARWPQWSPNGAEIAFIGEDGLCVVSADGGNLRTYPISKGASGAPSWSPDGRVIAVSVTLLGEHQSENRITGRDFRADGIGSITSFEQPILLVDVTTADARRLDFGFRCAVAPKWSPCGKFVLALATNSSIGFASYSPHLVVASVAESRVHTVLREGWYVTNAQWLDLQGRIVVVASFKSDITIPVTGLWVVDLNGSPAQCRTTGLLGNVGFRMHHDMPCWDLTQENVVAISSDTEAFATVQRAGAAEIWRIALTGDVKCQPRLDGPRSHIALGCNAQTGALLFAQMDEQSPPELHITRRDGSSPHRLTHLNDDVLARWPALSVERINFRSADDTPIDGWFFHQTALSTPLPTVLFIHAGPFSSIGHVFRFDTLLLASHGYGVMMANFRGSAGYGEGFSRAIMGDWGSKAFPDHLGAADAAIQSGVAEPDNIGVWGASHGGFATCWIVGHTQRFKAAVAEGAATNFATMYYLTDAPDTFAFELGGKPHEIPEVYASRSPLTYAHRSQTPTLLIHGEEDLRCPIAEAEQFHRALLDAGCVSELLRLRNASHLGDSSGPLLAREQQNAALLEWFGRHLRQRDMEGAPA